MSALHPAFDWHEIARLALTSRAMDDLEEQTLTPQGLVVYQFSARGHELGQLLLGQLLDRPGDAASVYYRSRPFLLGSGMTIEEGFASGMARQGSVNAGRDVGVVYNLPGRGRAFVLPMGGDVGSQYTPGVGWAQGLRYRVEQLGEADKAESITVIMGGDGSVATNGFWSALTMAATLRLPVLFVIEDNGYAISVDSQLQTPGGNIAANLAAFQGLTVWQGSGVQPAETAELVYTAVQHVRAGAGPGLLRLTVPRLSGHSGQDNQAYKSAETLAAEQAADPLPVLRSYLTPALLTAGAWESLAAKVERQVRAAADAAEAQPEPEPATVTTHVWAGAQPALVGGLAAEGIRLPAGRHTPQVTDPRRINMVQAVQRVLDGELALNPRLLVFGEDVGLKGGVHTATAGLQQKYGTARVFDTSLSEEGIIGRATGLALAGLLPAPEIQFRKYADPATEQLHNIGTLRWRTHNQCAAPMVVRIPVGFGRKIGDPWHSVTDEAMFAHAVGWQLAFPSNAEDCVGLLRAALRDDNPTIFFEHRAQLDAAWARRPYPGDDYVIPFGLARFIRRGDALTVVTWGALVERCDLAAQQLAASIEIIDLRTIIPWDKEAVLASVRKTSRCLIVHEDIGVAGFGAEVAAVIMQEVFLDLDAPITRLTAPSVPVPFNVGLMHAVVPTVELIQQHMQDLLAF